MRVEVRTGEDGSALTVRSLVDGRDAAEHGRARLRILEDAEPRRRSVERLDLQIVDESYSVVAREPDVTRVEVGVIGDIDDEAALLKNSMTRTGGNDAIAIQVVV